MTQPTCATTAGTMRRRGPDLPIEHRRRGDPRLDDFRDLTDRRPPAGPAGRPRPGDRRGRRRRPAAARLRVPRCVSLLGVPRRLAELAADLVDLDVPAYAVDADTMAAVVGFHLNRGVLAVADRVAPPDPRDLAARRAPLAVLEGVNDHENLGACSATPRRWAWTGCCSARAARTRCTGAACGCRWGTCCGCRSPTLPGEWPGSLDVLRMPGDGLRVVALTPDPTRCRWSPPA